MRKLVILFTGLIVRPSPAAGLAGVLSYGHDRYSLKCGANLVPTSSAPRACSVGLADPSRNLPS